MFWVNKGTTIPPPSPPQKKTFFFFFFLGVFQLVQTIRTKKLTNPILWDMQKNIPRGVCLLNKALVLHKQKSRTWGRIWSWKRLCLNDQITLLQRIFLKSTLWSPRTDTKRHLFLFSPFSIFVFIAIIFRVFSFLQNREQDYTCTYFQKQVDRPKAKALVQLTARFTRGCMRHLTCERVLYVRVGTRLLTFLLFVLIPVLIIF